MSKRTYNPNQLQGSQSSSSDGEHEEEAAEEESSKLRPGDDNNAGEDEETRDKLERTASATKEKERTEQTANGRSSLVSPNVRLEGNFDRGFSDAQSVRPPQIDKSQMVRGLNCYSGNKNLSQKDVNIHSQLPADHESAPLNIPNACTPTPSEGTQIRDLSTLQDLRQHPNMGTTSALDKFPYSALKSEVPITESKDINKQMMDALNQRSSDQTGGRCSVIFLFVLMFLGSLFYLTEVCCPFYFDAQINQDGLKLAGLLGADFEMQKESPYYNEERQKKLKAIGSTQKAFKDTPHAVKKKAPPKLQSPEGKGKKGGRNRKEEVVEQAPEEKLDDLGLSAPGTRNISISHTFRYYNYTEINLLNSKPDYYYEKLINQSQMDSVADEQTDEQNRKYLDKRNKGRPGWHQQDDSEDEKREDEDVNATEDYDPNLLMSFKNFLMYPKRSLKNVIHLAKSSTAAHINQYYAETYDKTIVFSNPELNEIDVESTRNLSLRTENLPNNDTAHKYLHFSDILPSKLEQNGVWEQDQNLLSFENLRKYNKIMYDQWNTERNQTEWLRIENIKKLYVTIQRDLLELSYPALVEQYVKRQLLKMEQQLESKKSYDPWSSTQIIKYLYNSDGIVQELCQNQDKNQLYIEFLAVRLVKQKNSQFQTIADTATYLRWLTKVICQSDSHSYNYQFKQQKIRNFENIHTVLGIQLPPNYKKMTFNLLSLEEKDYEQSFFSNKSSTTYAKYYNEINYIGKQIKSSLIYKDYVLAKSLQKQVEKMQERLIVSIASEVVRQRAYEEYGDSPIKCKQKIKKLFKTPNHKICFKELNPAKHEGALLWTELFIYENSLNNSRSSPQFERLKKVDGLINSDQNAMSIRNNFFLKEDQMRVESLYNQYVNGSEYTTWIREVIHNLTIDRSTEYGCKDRYCTLEEIGIAQFSGCKVLGNLPDSVKRYIKQAQASLWNRFPNHAKFTDGLELCQFTGNGFETSLDEVTEQEIKNALDSLKGTNKDYRHRAAIPALTKKGQNPNFVNFVETIYLANIERTSSFSSFDEYVEPWLSQTHDVVIPKNVNRAVKKQLEERMLKKKAESQEILLSQLAQKNTEEILQLSAKEKKYERNLNAMKVNDLNFDQMNKQARKNRYVVLGNQVQIGELNSIFGGEPFYFYTEYLGTNMIDFSSPRKEKVMKDGLQLTKYTSESWIQFDPSANKLNFHILNSEIRSITCNIYVEKYSGIVTEVDLQVNFDAQAGLIKNLPFVDYFYHQKMRNHDIFSHLYLHNQLKADVIHYAQLGQYFFGTLTMIQFFCVLHGMVKRYCKRKDQGASASEQAGAKGHPTNKSSGRRSHPGGDPFNRTYDTNASLEYMLQGLYESPGVAANAAERSGGHLKKKKSQHGASHGSNSNQAGRSVAESESESLGMGAGNNTFTHPSQKRRMSGDRNSSLTSYAHLIRKQQTALLNNSMYAGGIGRIQSQMMSRKGIVSELRQRRIMRAIQQKRNLGAQDSQSRSRQLSGKRRLPMDVVHERGSSAERSLQDSYEDVDDNQTNQGANAQQHLLHERSQIRTGTSSKQRRDPSGPSSQANADLSQAVDAKLASSERMDYSRLQQPKHEETILADLPDSIFNGSDQPNQKESRK